jgi:hypothetical protein
VIRFGVVLTVVLAAMGLLVGGVLANSLLLVYLAIGAAALAAIMLTAGVVIWREEVFGPSSAARASPAAKQVAGPLPVLAATGVAQPGRSAGRAADDLATIGAAARDDLVVEPPPPALPPRPEGAGRLEPQGYPDWPAPPRLQEQPGRLQRSDWPKRQEHPDRAGPSDRPARQEQRDRVNSSGRPEQPDLVQRSDRPGGQDEPDRANRSDRPEQVEPRKVAEPAAGQDSAGHERASRSPSGARPELLAEPVRGPRRGDETASGRVPPGSSEAAAADELRPLPAREPAAERQGERDADVPSWSFFTKAVKAWGARPDLTQVVGAEAGANGSGEGAGPADSREPCEGGGPGRSREPAGSGEPRGGREADQLPKAAHTAGAAAPDAARPPVSETAEREDRAPATSDAARPDTVSAARRDRTAADAAKREAPADLPEPESAEPEPVSAAAAPAAPNDAAVPGPAAEDESPAGPAVRDGHAARGPDTEVTVVPGITRYHRSQCILIRFLGPEDLQTMTLQAAETASYVPCKACRPEQVLAGD